MKNNLQNIMQEDKNEKFFDFWSRYYYKGIAGKILLNIIKKTLAEVTIKKGLRVLDVGTGTGNFLYLLERKNKNIKLYGIDISEKMLKIARKKVTSSVLRNISVVYLDKKFKKEFFDFIFVIDAFHHFPEQKKVMNNFYKILKNNGRLIITELDFGFVFNYFFHVIEPGNEWLYTKNEIKNLFLEAGFFVENQKKIGLFAVMTVGVKLGKYRERIK